jgi:hypothetical protein
MSIPPGERSGSHFPELSSRAYAAYLVATGVWPLLHYRSFEAVSGPKSDVWLVKTFGALTAAVGLSLTKDRHSAELLTLVVSGTIAIADVLDVVCADVRPVYLADAAVQGSAFAASCRRRRALLVLLKYKFHAAQVLVCWRRWFET